LVEGVANLVLSIILVRHYGILGDAIGTAIPLACTQIFFLPAHLCRLLGVKVTTYLYRAFVLPLLLCMPMIGALLLMQRWFVPHRLRELFLQFAIAAGVYAIGLGWAFWANRAWNVGHLGANAEDEVALALVETYQEEA
jgi:O-antigen/teichoic acid export membrane protein